ncbi:MAG TPA: Na+/H+ antiporter NhaA, partial [Steroidobacteraceae bacterium]|nr:Na+/H+ antiporter NhaA [Steroidobacteraceae bacterium]
RGVPPALRLLLLTLAIIDDIAAILVIALFYSGGIAALGLLVVAAGVALLLLLQWLSVRSALVYLLPGALLWSGMLRAGLHPTLAGVALGLLMPATAAFGRRAAAVVPGTESPLARLESLLHPWVAFGVMPLFALANAGVALGGLDLHAGAALAVSGGIVLGLVVGKPAGIALATAVAVRSGLCALPDGLRWSHVAILGALGGIGFTMSIFISNLAFEGTALLGAARLAVLAASACAALLGFALGRLGSSRADIARDHSPR